MRICFVSSMHPPDDKRVFGKEALSLISAGFEVIHLAPAHDSEPGDRDIQGVRVSTFPPFAGLAGRFFGLTRLYRMARKLEADVYHCNEVDSWVVGVALRLFAGRTCVFDVHEHYPEEFVEVRISKWAQPLVKTAIAGVMRVLSWFTKRIVLAKKSLESDFGHMPEGTVFLVQNFVPIAELPNPEKDLHNTGPLKLIHLGLFNRFRGWPQLLEAMTLSHSQDTELLVLGTINDGSEEEFLSKVKELGLADRIHFESWMPYDQAMARLKSSDVGVVCFQPGLFNHVHALPHKMFDYMGAKLATIAPDFAVEVAEIIKDSNSGLLVDTSDARSIAKAIDQLSEDRMMVRRMGNSGYSAVLKKYNWEKEAEKLVTMYKDLGSELGIQ